MIIRVLPNTLLDYKLSIIQKSLLPNAHGVASVFVTIRPLKMCRTIRMPNLVALVPLSI